MSEEVTSKFKRGREMKDNLTEIVCIIDRSGSMDVLKKDAIGGFNEFLKTQKEAPGEATLSLILFDHEYLLLHDNINIQDVPELTSQTYVPRGSTALLDAIGRAIKTIGERLSNTKEEDRPGKILVVILTDGQENNSSEYSRDTIKDMIQHQKDVYNWAFMFLSSDLSAVADAQSYGISKGNTMSFMESADGYTKGYGKMSAGATMFRSMCSTDMSAEERDTLLEKVADE